jgi:hypothetical protein
VTKTIIIDEFGPHISNLIFPGTFSRCCKLYCTIVAEKQQSSGSGGKKNMVRKPRMNLTRLGPKSGLFCDWCKT